jgi:hypothetical protein
MNETIRDYVNRRLRRFYAVWGLGVALVLVPGALNEHGGLSRLMTFAGLLLLAGGAMVMASVKCPKCSKPLGKSFMWQRGTLDFCPKCNARLDESRP